MWAAALNTNSCAPYLAAQDSFYRPLTKEQMVQAHANNYDFDHPDSLDLDLLTETLRKLKGGERVDIPVYDFGTHSRLSEIVPMYGASVVVFEGLFAFATPELRDLIDLKVFVDEDPDIRFARRMKRDLAERGRDLHGVIAQWKKFVKPSFETHIKPTMKHADLVIPRGTSNTVAMDMLIKEVRKQLERRGLNIRREVCTEPHPHPPSLSPSRVPPLLFIIHHISPTTQYMNPPRARRPTANTRACAVAHNADWSRAPLVSPHRPKVEAAAGTLDDTLQPEHAARRLCI
jgi:uridine kinase